VTGPVAQPANTQAPSVDCLGTTVRDTGATNAEAGFSLIEALVALVVMAIGLATLYATAGTTVRATADAGLSVDMTIIARSALNEALAVPTVKPGTETGRLSIYRWTRTVRAIADTNDKPGLDDVDGGFVNRSRNGPGAPGPAGQREPDAGEAGGLPGRSGQTGAPGRRQPTGGSPGTLPGQQSAEQSAVAWQLYEVEIKITAPRGRTFTLHTVRAGELTGELTQEPSRLSTGGQAQ